MELIFWQISPIFSKKRQTGNTSHFGTRIVFQIFVRSVSSLQQLICSHKMLTETFSFYFFFGRTLANYMMWMVVESFYLRLGDVFDDISKNFYLNLDNYWEPTRRQDLCIQLMKAKYFEVPLSRIYVDQLFSGDSKKFVRSYYFSFKSGVMETGRCRVIFNHNALNSHRKLSKLALKYDMGNKLYMCCSKQTFVQEPRYAIHEIIVEMTHYFVSDGYLATGKENAEFHIGIEPRTYVSPNPRPIFIEFIDNS